MTLLLLPLPLLLLLLLLPPSLEAARLLLITVGSLAASLSITTIAASAQLLPGAGLLLPEPLPAAGSPGFSGTSSV
jgi:hypothetical protein